MNWINRHRRAIIATIVSLVATIVLGLITNEISNNHPEIIGQTIFAAYQYFSYLLNIRIPLYGVIAGTLTVIVVIVSYNRWKKPNKLRIFQDTYQGLRINYRVDPLTDIPEIISYSCGECGEPVADAFQDRYDGTITVSCNNGHELGKYGGRGELSPSPIERILHSFQNNYLQRQMAQYSDKERVSGQQEIIQSLQRVVDHQEVWVCGHRAILYPIPFPGQPKVLGVSIFASESQLKRLSGWTLTTWPPPGLQLTSHVQSVIESFLRLQRWSIEDYPLYAYREWSDLTDLSHIANDISEAIETLGELNQEIKLKRIE